MLALRGALEDGELYPIEGFAEQTPAPVEVHIVSGADHFYAGHEDEVASIVADWLASLPAR